MQSSMNEYCCLLSNLGIVARGRSPTLPVLRCFANSLNKVRLLTTTSSSLSLFSILNPLLFSSTTLDLVSLLSRVIVHCKLLRLASQPLYTRKVLTRAIDNMVRGTRTVLTRKRSRATRMRLAGMGELARERYCTCSMSVDSNQHNPYLSYTTQGIPVVNKSVYLYKHTVAIVTNTKLFYLLLAGDVVSGFTPVTYPVSSECGQYDPLQDQHLMETLGQVKQELDCQLPRNRSCEDIQQLPQATTAHQCRSTVTWREIGNSRPTKSLDKSSQSQRITAWCYLPSGTGQE